MLDLYLPFLAFTFGAIVGSFLNVCIFRLPKEQSIITPPSSCPHCGAEIRFYDNIPILSFFFLRGRCRHCKGSISAQYPAVEALSGISSTYLFIRFSFSWSYFLYIVFISSLIVITFIDLRHQIIPNKITYPGIPFGFGASFLLVSITPVESLLGILAGGLGLATIATGFKALRKKEGMGLGDVKLLAMIGAFLGWKGVIISLVSASIVGAIIGYSFLRFKKKSTQEPIPFGPFLAMGAIVHMVCGEQIIAWYTGIGYH